MDFFDVDCPREFYLVRQPVLQHLKPDKVLRVVNGAANFYGSSLSNALLTELNLLQNLIHVFFGFHQYRYAVSAEF